MDNESLIQKASGATEPYAQYKLKNFLRKIKVPDEAIDRIVHEAEHQLGHTPSTKQIREIVTKELLKLKKGQLLAARYNLKQHIRQMGPAGHAFEKFVGRLFKADGYDVQTALIVQGECVPHEIDVLAHKGNHLAVVECKFHNQEGIKSDVIVALYMHARYMDIVEEIKKPGFSQSVWIASNTKLTSQALDYANCKGMHVLNVEYPEKENIMTKVMQHNLYPITVASELEPYFQTLFLEDKIVINDILNMTDTEVKQMGIPPEAMAEARLNVMKMLAE